MNRTEFINRVDYLNDAEHCVNLKVYAGVADELNVEAVINPF